MTRNVLASLALALLACAGQQASAQTAPADIVKQRQHAMESLWDDSYRAVARTVRTDQAGLGAGRDQCGEGQRDVAKIGDLVSARDRARCRAGTRAQT